MSNKIKIIIGIASVVVIFAIIFCIVVSLVPKKFETEKYSISVPFLYFDIGGDNYSHFILANDIVVGKETVDDLSLKGHEITTEEEFLTYLKLDGKLYTNGETIIEEEYSLWAYDTRVGVYVYRNAIYVCKNEDTFWYLWFSASTEDFDDLRKDIPDIIESFKIK